MQLLENPKHLPPIGSYSDAYQGTLTNYNFSRQRSQFLRELKDFPFALGQILTFNIPLADKSKQTSSLSLITERIIGEWLAQHAEHAFKPAITHIYRSGTGKEMIIPAKVNDFTFLDQGEIFNIELKFIVANGPARKNVRLQRGTVQLQATAEMLHYLSQEQDPESDPIKTKNLILVVRRQPVSDAPPPDLTISRSQWLYQKLLCSAQALENDSKVPRMIITYQELNRIFKNLYPGHRAKKDFKGTEQCFAELDTFTDQVK